MPARTAIGAAGTGALAARLAARNGSHDQGMVSPDFAGKGVLRAITDNLEQPVLRGVTRTFRKQVNVASFSV